MPQSLDEARQIAREVARPTTVQVSHPDWPEPRAVAKPFASPQDWRDQWIYFLMVDRFNGPGQPHDWDRTTDRRMGGTFEGIRAQLPYLQELGVGAIWMTPILKNRDTYQGYGIQDFLRVEPSFGSSPEAAEDELIALIDEAHARGIYVIADIVINHCGDLFAYETPQGPWDELGWQQNPQPILWRNNQGEPTWSTIPHLDGQTQRDSAVWPRDLQRNEYFRRRGKDGSILQGDFYSLKELHTELVENGDHPVWNHMISVYQYAIARFDFDGFRIDTMRHVEREFALIFSNAMREYALSIGKKNFFIFGETRSGDTDIVEYVGRYTSDEDGVMGADAALDFPLCDTLAAVAKAQQPPTHLVDLLQRRKATYDKVLSTHGEATRFFVTFIDTHDDHHRFLFPADGGDWSRQVSMALALLFCLPGIPCVYYGTEQGLKGTRELYEPHGNESPEMVREALWGKPNAFDRDFITYRHLRAISAVRDRHPALRYGRLYFRQVSGNGADFGFSQHSGGILALSRLLFDSEVLIVANTSTTQDFEGWVVVDARIHQDSTVFESVFSNHELEHEQTCESGPATFHGPGTSQQGWCRRVRVSLKVMEVAILAPKSDLS